MATQLPVSRLINVSVTLTRAAAQAQSLNQLLLLSILPNIDQYERYRTYADIDEVGLDFDSTTDEYIAAQLWFSQTPQPTSLMIGRWAKTNAVGGVKGYPLPSTDTYANPANWALITNGSFAYQVDGGSTTNVTGLNFSSVTDMNGVAAIINAAITSVAACVWNSNYQRFEISSKTLGASSSVSFLFPVSPSTGTDISGKLNLDSSLVNKGGYLYQGMVAESVAHAYNYFNDNYGQMWYAVVSTACNDANALQFALNVEASTNKHIYGYTTQDATALLTTDTTSVAYTFNQQGFTRTMLQYSSTNKYAIVAAISKLLSVDYTAQYSAITLMYKGETLIVPESLNSSQANALESKQCNVFVNYDNNTAIFEKGVMCADGVFADQITNTDALAVDLQTRLYNVLYTSPTKIPQTDAGVHILVANIEDVCTQFVFNGVLAPGQWNSNGFGVLKYGDNLPKGFYVYAPPVASQDPAQRATRVCPTIQVAAKLAGAIHSINLSVVVNQ